MKDMAKIREILDRLDCDNGMAQGAKEKAGSAYKVPEGYFETLNKRIMEAIPKETRQRNNIYMAFLSKRKYAVAACLTGLVIGTGLLAFHTWNKQDTISTTIAEVQQETITDEYIKECMEYAMVDDNDLYAYLADQ